MVVSTKERSGSEELMNSKETISIRLAERTLPGFFGSTVKNLAYGINLYKNTIDKADCAALIGSLETELSKSDVFEWEKSEEKPVLRAALEFSLNKKELEPETKLNKELHKIYDSVFDPIKKCIDDYASSWEIGINYYAPLNFVKYSYPDNYFGLHTDHGPSTVRTVSAILYLNDDYEGGNLHFPRIDQLSIKPETGDIIVFPSTYTYQHESIPLMHGTKYVVLAFTDFEERV
jgi:hypothetical protein